MVHIDGEAEPCLGCHLAEAMNEWLRKAGHVDKEVDDTLIEGVIGAIGGLAGDFAVACVVTDQDSIRTFMMMLQQATIKGYNRAALAAKARVEQEAAIRANPGASRRH